MGMSIYDALVLTQVALSSPTRSVLTLGVPTLNFSYVDYRHAGKKSGFAVKDNAFQDFRGFFAMLGYQRIASLDISAYEGAEILGDLNDPNLAQKIGTSYDLVYDCGTLEHIFDISTALHTVDRLVNPGGIVLHASPTNGFTDHGFWQISPDLFRTFYTSRGFTILTSVIFTMGVSPTAIRAEENIYRSRGRKFIAENFPEALAVFAARKPESAAGTDISMQDYYSSMHGAREASYEAEFFISYGSLKRARLWKIPLLRMPFSALRAARHWLRGTLARK